MLVVKSPSMMAGRFLWTSYSMKTPYADYYGSDFDDYTVTVNGFTFRGLDHEVLMDSGLSGLCFPTFRTHLCFEHAELSDHELTIRSQRQLRSTSPDGFLCNLLARSAYHTHNTIEIANFALPRQGAGHDVECKPSVSQEVSILKEE